MDNCESLETVLLAAGMKQHGIIPHGPLVTIPSPVSPDVKKDSFPHLLGRGKGDGAAPL